ncbi:MAG TPA: hypothetical protein VGL72_20920 [Bryobacteraceae bacterium]|jgi:hypothetical protein
MNPDNLRTLRRAVLATIPLWVCAAAPLFGDVTLRYQSTIKAGTAAPPQVKEQLENSHAWGNSTLRMKNGQGWSQAGPFLAIIDFAAEQLTLIDAEHKHFAKVPVAELPDKVSAAMPKPPELSEEARKAMAAIKTTSESKVTGRTDTILGIQAEERQFMITIEMPMPAGAQKPAMSMKMVIEIWNAKPDEALHNPGVRELMGYKLWANYFMNPARMMEKMLANMPGDSSRMVKSMMEGVSANNSVTLRMRMGMYLPLPGAADPESLMFEMTNEAVELSATPVDASIFQIPAGYQTVDAGELLKNVMERQMAEMGTAKQ